MHPKGRGQHVCLLLRKQSSSSNSRFLGNLPWLWGFRSLAEVQDGQVAKEVVSFE